MKKQWNWPIWLGFLAILAGFFSYPFFMRFAVTRDFPWVNVLLLLAGLGLLCIGLFHAFGRPAIYRGKVFGTLFAGFSLLIVAFFSYIAFYELRQLPASTGAPHIGQKAPGFTLPDQEDRQVSFSDLLTEPVPSDAGAKPKAVLLIFYRGFW